MITLEKVSKKYGTGTALDDISLHIEGGEFVFLTGPSGAGKSTLLKLLIRDTLPTTGSIQVSDFDVVHLPANKVPQLRRRIGVVFQDLKMLTDRTILENVLLPLEMAGMDEKEAKKRVNVILEQVGIAEHTLKFPVQLSGGELQRAAIARALVFSPEILLADEPTGNLDATTSWEIVKLLQDINKTGTTVLMATHNMDIIQSLQKRKIALEKGKLVHDDKKTAAPKEHATHEEKEEKNEEKHETTKHHTDHEAKPEHEQPKEA